MTGIPYDDGKKTEIIDLLDPNNHCISVDFSYGVQDPFGGLIEPNVPMLCGGYIKSSDSKSSDCYTLTNRQFIESESSLRDKTYWSYGNPVVNGALIVVGGQGDSAEKLKTASMVSPFEVKALADMPVGNRGHCTLILDENRIMVTGGNSDTRNYDSSTWIYKFDDDAWEDGPPMNEGRSGQACGTFENQGKTIAVVVGAYGTNGYVNTVEYWVVDSESGWEVGPPLPTFAMNMGNLIASPDGKGLLHIGGGTSGKVTGEIFQLVCPKNLASCQWEKLPQKLQHARRGQVSMLIPDSLAKDLCQ